MSVINQVLNQIEQRGAQRLPGQSMVRAVPPGRDTRKFKAALLLLGMVLAVSALVWQWPRIKKPVVAATSNVQVKPVTVVATPASGIMNEPVVEILVPASQSSPGLNAVSSPSLNAGKGNDAVAAAPVKPLGQSIKPLLSPHSPATDQYAAAPAKSLNEPNKPLPSRRGSSTSPHALTSERPLSESSDPTQSQGLPDTRAAAPASSGDLPKKQISPAQQADAEFQKASGLAQQGNITDALAGYEAVLRLNPGHDAARQALVALLLENKRNTDAERILHDGIKSRPEQASFAMLLARLQVERGAVAEALATLEKSLPFADRQADYQAFFAALLQRQNRHNEAIAHYQIVLQLAPNNAIWLMGYGISLRAVQRNAEAKDAFKRALEAQTLSPELREFVQQKLKGL